jgi:putative cardiolipin synthase
LKRSAAGIRIGPRGSGRIRASRAGPAASPRGRDSDGTNSSDDAGGGGISSGNSGGSGSASLGGSGLGSIGSSDASLHAKAFAIDGERIVIGSFNFDPRSALYNTELGVVIDSPAWAQRLSRSFDRQIPLNAYRVQFDDRGRLEWIERRADGSEERYDREPHASFGRKLLVRLLGLLPIERLL